MAKGEGERMKLQQKVETKGQKIASVKIEVSVDSCSNVHHYNNPTRTMEDNQRQVVNIKTAWK